ncbi:MAG: transaldolase [Actinomycetia bacterium]|nr:transaldolase [Actinomycetes bacterium]
MTPSVLTELTAAGVSLWLDDLSRARLDGDLQRLVQERAISGVTTNPTIFQKAIAGGGNDYAAQLQDLRVTGVDVDSAIRTLTTDDVRAACDILAPVYASTGGLDGRVSIEVDPRLAHDTQATVNQARELWTLVDRPNAMIKIPATTAGLPAITRTLAEGISVNVTLIFSIDRYREVMAAHTAGIGRAHDSGVDVSGIESVASFFVSRVDTAVDAQLSESTSALADGLRGRAAIANAHLAWHAYEIHTASDDWRRLAAAGARPQRPLWASTGVKHPDYDPTRYVMQLAAPGCVNTVPESTLEAVVTKGRFGGDTVSGGQEAAQSVLEDLAAVGIDFQEICTELEAAGEAAFVSSWESLRTTVERALQA